MNYIKDVLNYYLKNFIYILVITIIPAVILGLIANPFALAEFLANYPSYKITTFGDLFFAVYNLGWIDVLWIVLSLIILVVYLSIMLGFIESHFRTGNPSLVNSLKINLNALSVIKTAIVLAIYTFVVNFVLLLLIYLLHILTAVDGYGASFVMFFNYVIAIFGLYPIARGFSLVSFANIEMLINGSPFRVAMSNAFLAVGQNVMSVFVVEVIIFLTTFMIATICSLIGVAWLGSILGLLIILPLMCVSAMNMFFKYYGLKRYDNRKYYNLR